MKKASRKSSKRRDATCRSHFNITMTSQIDVRPACGRRAAVSFYLCKGLVRVCEKELSRTGKNNRNPVLVSDKELSQMGKTEETQIYVQDCFYSD